ncbi:hypothetical protein [Pedobacter glucosidilyticus]|uniref:hypothetical protein n=1 Tax=Pedobacter glucosidilyticus TaxID=1122941 RepID=UPI000421ABF1|nr:hypothetical protein [Pedobacter glucosidilyticus]
MKTLTLQITKLNFDAILDGSQKQEERQIWPNTVKRYIVDPDALELELIKYDALYLINGRQKNARRLTVEVLDAELFFEVDEENKQITYFENGIEYDLAFVSYSLGKILSTENC